MILKARKKFDKYVVGKRRESCGYREVYDAKYEGSKVVLTVYDVEQIPARRPAAGARSAPATSPCPVKPGCWSG